MSVESKQYRLLIVAAILQIVWGLVPSASQFVIDEIPIELYIAIRWTISGFIFVCYLIFTQSWRKLSFGTFSIVALLGILGYGVASLGSLYGLKIGGVAHFAMTASLAPAITSIICILVLKERPKKIFYFALPISVTGLIVLVLGHYRISSWRIAGLSTLCILGGAVLEAFVFVFSKKLKSKMNTFQYLAITQIAAAAFMWLLQILAFHQTSQLFHLSFRGVLAALFVSIIACVLCYVILYWLLEHVDGHRLALFDSFHAISATLFGVLIFAERLTFFMLLGGALILTGLITGNLPQKMIGESPE